MATLNVMVHRIFRRAWQRYGRPLMYVVHQISEWSLPAGFSYDDETDSIHNAVGTWLPNEGDYWLGDYVYIVPTRRTADLDVLIAAGVVPEGTVDVYILHSDVEDVRHAHACEISGDWYDVVDVGRAPVGFETNGVWARVRLRRRA